MVSFTVRHKILIISVTGDIDQHNASSIREQIDLRISHENVKKVIFDFSKLDFMDSSGIGLIIGRYRLMRMWDGEILLSGMSKRIEMIVRLSGAEKIVTMERREQNAG